MMHHIKNALDHFFFVLRLLKCCFSHLPKQIRAGEILITMVKKSLMIITVSSPDLANEYVKCFEIRDQNSDKQIVSILLPQSLFQKHATTLIHL